MAKKKSSSGKKRAQTDEEIIEEFMANNPDCIGSVLRAPLLEFHSTRNQEETITFKTPIVEFEMGPPEGESSGSGNFPGIPTDKGILLPSMNGQLSELINAEEYERRFGKKVDLSIFEKAAKEGEK